jgi:hypothetical protein
MVVRDEPIERDLRIVCTVLQDNPRFVSFEIPSFGLTGGPATDMLPASFGMACAVSFTHGRESGNGEEGRGMGWVMLFWVFVIVGVPTVLWFLLSEPGRSSRLPDAERKGGDGP